jgi:hypothetical protein
MSNRNEGADTPKRKPGRPVGTHKPPKYTARLNIYLTPEQLVELRRMASEAGCSASGLVRGKLGLE